MSAALPPSGWTQHGHPVDGVARLEADRPAVARCGGPSLCSACARDAMIGREAAEPQQHDGTRIRPTPEWAKGDPAVVLVYHQRLGIKGCTCGWAELGRSHAEHQLAALSEAGWAVVPETRIADLERKNTNLGRLANGGVPEGYALVKAGLS